MNLLAHLHAGDFLEPEASAGNLTADFCRDRGTPEFELGRRVHLRIDSFTDTHSGVMAARKLFDAKLRRFAPVILDIAFDYCLSQTWQQWAAGESREDFIESRLTQILAVDERLPAKSASMVRIIHGQGWLPSYGRLDGIAKVLERIAYRRPRFKPMIGASDVIGSRYDDILSVFQGFYPELLEHVRAVEGARP